MYLRSHKTYNKHSFLVSKHSKMANDGYIMKELNDEKIKLIEKIDRLKFNLNIVSPSNIKNQEIKNKCLQSKLDEKVSKKKLIADRYVELVEKIVVQDSEKRNIAAKTQRAHEQISTYENRLFWVDSMMKLINGTYTDSIKYNKDVSADIVQLIKNIDNLRMTIDELSIEHTALKPIEDNINQKFNDMKEQMDLKEKCLEITQENMNDLEIERRGSMLDTYDLIEIRDKLMEKNKQLTLSDQVLNKEVERVKSILDNVNTEDHKRSVLDILLRRK